MEKSPEWHAEQAEYHSHQLFLENRKLKEEVSLYKKAFLDCCEGLEGHFGPDFWQSNLGQRIAFAFKEALR